MVFDSEAKLTYAPEILAAQVHDHDKLGAIRRQEIAQAFDLFDTAARQSLGRQQQVRFLPAEPGEVVLRFFCETDTKRFEISLRTNSHFVA